MYSVLRYCKYNPNDPLRPTGDFLRVERNGVDVFGEVIMGPNGPLHPQSAEEARSRPWFYAGSPFGAEIVELARERGLLNE